MGVLKKNIFHNTHFDERYDDGHLYVIIEVKIDSDIIESLDKDEYDYLNALITYASESLHVKIVRRLKEFGNYTKEGGE